MNEETKRALDRIEKIAGETLLLVRGKDEKGGMVGEQRAQGESIKFLKKICGVLSTMVLFVIGKLYM